MEITQAPTAESGVAATEDIQESAEAPSDTPPAPETPGVAPPEAPATKKATRTKKAPGIYLVRGRGAGPVLSRTASARGLEPLPLRSCRAAFPRQQWAKGMLGEYIQSGARRVPTHLMQANVGHASVATSSRYLHPRPCQSSAEFIVAR